MAAAETFQKRIFEHMWFAGVPDGPRAELVARGHILRRTEGEWLYAEGDTDVGLMLVLEGGVQLYAQAPGGHEALFALLSPGSLVGQSVMVGGEARIMTAIAGRGCVVLMVPDSVLKDVAARHPELWQYLLALTHTQARRLLRLAVEALTLTPRQRMVARLLDLSERSRIIPLSQAQLAEMTGVSRKAVNSWLGDLEERGMIARLYGQIEVLDRTKLKRLVAAGSPAGQVRPFAETWMPARGRE